MERAITAGEKTLESQRDDVKAPEKDSSGANGSWLYAATCLFGLEKFLGEEIDALGYRRVETMDGRVLFAGPPEAGARANLWLRTAERLYLVVGRFDAPTFDALFEGMRALPWEDWIGREDAFPVSGHSVKSRLFSLPDCQSVAKKAIVERLRSRYGGSILPECGITVPVEFFLLNDRAMAMIDLSGTALHKRGYRPAALAAPLRETLAAALVKIAHAREDVLFWDPMCGSGTIPIEAALLMTNRAPGRHRAFAAEAFPAFPAPLWQKAREEADDLVKKDSVFEAYASDIDPAAVEIARANCVRAGVTGVVKAFERDALTIRTGGRRGTVVCNPPYGERLLTPEAAEALYCAMGRHFATLDRWQIYILTSHETFARLYGRRPDKVRKLYNGRIRCYLYQFYKTAPEKK